MAHSFFLPASTVSAKPKSERKDIGELHTAETLQPFQDIRGNLFQEFESPCSGLQYLPRQVGQTSDKLYFCWGPLFQEFGLRPSHGWCELDLAKADPVGPWHIGDHVNLYTSGYLFDIPRTWASKYTSGMCLATGRFREGDQHAQGPSLFAIAPWMEGNPPQEGTRLKTTPLLLYSAAADGGQSSLRDHHASDEWTGAAWLTAGDKSAVIFVGTKGHGKGWYGFSNGVVWPEEPPYPPVPDGPDQELNWWSERFIGQFLFYDPDDLAAVATGDKQPYEPQPYATMEIDEYLYGIGSHQQRRHVGAVSFDRERGYFYLLEFRGDGDKSLAHVWRVTDQPR